MGKHYLSEEELVEGLNARTPEAYEQLYPRFYNKLFYVAFRLTRDSQESEDIVRSVFIELYTKHLHVQFKSFPSASNYIYVAVKNRAVNYWLSYSRKFVGELHDEEIEDRDADWLSAKYGETLWNLHWERVEDILEHMDKRFIEVLKLIYIKQKKTSEVAKIMGITPQTVINLKGHGLTKVAKMLRKAQISAGPFFLMLLLHAL